MTTIKYILTILLTGTVLAAVAQNNGGAVPFLTITPDARELGMGNTGAGSAADAFSIFRNAAKSVFSGKTGEMAYSYTPWMRDLLSGCYLHSAAGYYNLGRRHSVLIGYRSFTGSKMEVYNDTGKPEGTFTPRDWAVDLGYSLALLKNLSVSVTGRFIRTDMSALSDEAKDDLYAFDLGAYYFHAIQAHENSRWSLGMQIANIGGRVDYGYRKYNLPTKVTLGGGLEISLNEKHRLEGAIDLGYRLFPADNKSFDASLGAGYTYARLVTLRAGYHYGDQEKGDNRYGTLGCGIEYWHLRGDFAWIFPEGPDSPLKNTWQVSVGVDLGIFKGIR